MLCKFACGWIGGWILAGCILTAVDGMHACDHDVWIKNVCMYCNKRCVFVFQGLLLYFNLLLTLISL